MKKILFLFIILFCAKANANIFIKTDKGYVLQEKGLEGSINDICKRLGYDTNQFYSYWPDIKSDISGVCFKIFTTDIICVLTQDNISELRDQDVRKYLADFDFSFEYSTYNRESDLSEGIEKKNLSIKFLSEILDIPYDVNTMDTMLVCDKFKYNMYFKDGFLCKFESSDGYNRAAKEFMESSPEYFNTMKMIAKEYWDNDTKNIQNELNVQCQALFNIPNGFKNEYLSKFSLKYGCYNFKIVTVLYYGDTITLREYKDICHGDVKFISEEIIKGEKVYIYGYKGAVFTFSKDGNLLIAKP